MKNTNRINPIAGLGIKLALKKQKMKELNKIADILYGHKYNSGNLTDLQRGLVRIKSEKT